MSITRFLPLIQSITNLFYLVEDSRKNIERFLKLPKNIADRFHELDSKNAFPLALVFKLWCESDGQYGSDSYDYAFDVFFDEDRGEAADGWMFFDAFKDNPSLPKKILSGYNSKSIGSIEDVFQVYDQYVDKTSDELLKRSETDGIRFLDGWYWVPLKSSECNIEGNLMQHCGTDKRGTLWSLRDSNNKPHVTLTYNDANNSVYQIKGKQNTVPDRKYWKRIESFFKQKRNPMLLDTELMSDIGPGGELSDRIARLSVNENQLLQSYNISYDFVESREDGDLVVTMFFYDSYSEKKLGFVKAVEDDRLNVFMVKRSQIDNPSMQGRGLGPALYEKLSDYVKSKYGKKLASDVFRSDQADAMWRKMKNAGKASQPYDYPFLKTKSGEQLNYYVMEAPALAYKLDVKFVDSYNDDGDREVEAKLFVGKKEIGHITSVMHDRLNVFMVKDAELLPSFRRKGLGSQAYNQLNTYVKNKYRVPLASDYSRSTDAEGLWSSMKNTGKATGPHKFTQHGNLDYYKMESAWKILESVLDDFNVSVELLNDYDDDGEPIIVATVYSHNKKIGEVLLYEDHVNNTVRISSARIDSNLRGKGLGTEIYREINRQLKNRGMTLSSDTSRSEPAEKVWQKLSAAGEAEKKHHPVFKSGYYSFK